MRIVIDLTAKGAFLPGGLVHWLANGSFGGGKKCKVLVAAVLIEPTEKEALEDMIARLPRVSGKDANGEAMSCWAFWPTPCLAHGEGGCPPNDELARWEDDGGK